MAAKAIAVLAAVLLTVNHAFASGHVIDQDTSDIVLIGQKLCTDPSARISKLSTVSQLVSYFDSAESSDDWFASCRDEYRKPLIALNEVIETGSNDVCGYEKVTKISKFHWNYVIGTLSKKWSKTLKSNIPESLRDFFVDYATEITELCKRNVIGNLDLAAGDNDVQVGEAFAKTLDKKLDSLKTILVAKSKIKNYEDFSLPWEMIINQLKRKGKISEDMVDEGGDLFIMVLKMQYTAAMLESQRVCRFDLRPIYQETVLPAMRLIDMGYGSSDKSLEQEVDGSEMLKNWYEITQICELLLPIFVHKDETLAQGETVIVNTEEEIDSIFSCAKLPTPRHEIPSTTNVNSLQLDDTIKAALSTADEKELLSSVKSNIKKRAQLYRKLTKNIAASAKDKFKSALKSVFVSRKSRTGALIKEQPDSALLDKSNFDELLDDDLDNTNLVRNKRTVTNEVREKRREIKAVVAVIVGVLTVLALIAFIIALILSALHVIHLG